MVELVYINILNDLIVALSAKRSRSPRSGLWQPSLPMTFEAGVSSNLDDLQ
jgi:hypothetical protein